MIMETRETLSRKVDDNRSEVEQLIGKRKHEVITKLTIDTVTEKQAKQKQVDKLLQLECEIFNVIIQSINQESTVEDVFEMLFEKEEYGPSIENKDQCFAFFDIMNKFMVKVKHFAAMDKAKKFMILFNFLKFIREMIKKKGKLEYLQPDQVEGQRSTLKFHMVFQCEEDLVRFQKYVQSGTIESHLSECLLFQPLLSTFDLNSTDVIMKVTDITETEDLEIYKSSDNLEIVHQKGSFDYFKLSCLTLFIVFTPVILACFLANTGQTESFKGNLTFLMIGRRGVGKSNTANAILNNNTFKGGISSEAVTTKASSGVAYRFGRQITVVDTPGLYSIHSETEILLEFWKCFALTPPGFNAIILVVPICRIFDEDGSAINFFENHFGPELFDFLIVVFTGKDLLQNLSLMEVIDFMKDNSELKKLYYTFLQGGNIAFGLTDTDKDVEKLIDAAVSLSNDGKEFYTKAMFEFSQNHPWLVKFLKFMKRKEL